MLISATAGPEGAQPGELLALKVFARDGALPDDSLVSNAPVTPQESDVRVEPRAFAPALRPLLVTLAEFLGTVN